MTYFIPETLAAVQKTVRADGTAELTNDTLVEASAGLVGASLQADAGEQLDWLVYPTDYIVDRTERNSDASDASHVAVVQFAVTPRYFVGRG